MEDIINTSENIHLLLEYLTRQTIVEKEFSKKEALEFSKFYIEKNKDNLFGPNGVAMQLGEKNIEFFCMYYLQDTFVPKESNTARKLAPTHLEIWHELQEMFINDKWDKEEFILPRGCSKSTIINKALSCFLHCYKKSRYTIVIGNKEQDAVNFISDTKIMLQNKYIEYSFGKLIDKASDRTLNKIELELSNNTKIQAFSLGSSVRGTTYGSTDGVFRPTTIILDDILKADDILSDGSKEKIVDKFYKEISQVGDSAVIRNKKKIKLSSKFLIIGTPLAPDCFINTIKNDVSFRVFHRAVVNFDVDEYFYNNEYWQTYKKILFDDRLEDSKHEAEKYYYDHLRKMKFETIWEKYSCVELAEFYFNKRTAFMQELMCDCQNIGERWFKSNRVMPKEEIEENTFTKTMLCVDCAGVKNKDKSRADYFAFVVGSMGNNTFKYVRYGDVLKFNEFDDYISHVVNLVKEFEDITHIYVEKNTYNGLDAEQISNKLLTELPNRRVQMINEMQKKNKDSKISTIVDSVNNGRIIFCRERVSNEALKQLMDFSGQDLSLHDDFPDVVSEFSNRIDEIKVVQSFKFFDRKLLF